MKKFHKDFFAWILLAILALTPAWGVLPANAAEPADALSARPENSVYVAARISALNGLIKTVFAPESVEAFISVMSDDAQADQVRAMITLAAQITAESVAASAGVGEEGPFFQMAASMPEKIRGRLNLVAVGKASADDLAVIFLGENGAPFSGMFEHQVQQGDKGPYYVLFGGATALASRNGLILAASSPRELDASLDAMSGSGARLALKRRFKGADYFFLHSDMQTAAALDSSESKDSAAALAVLFEAPLEVEADFDMKQNAFLMSLGANFLEAMPSMNYLKELKPAAGANFFLAGGGSPFFGLAGKTFFDASQLRAQPEAAQAWSGVAAMLSSAGIEEKDIESLFTGSMTLIVGNAASVFGLDFPGCYLAVTGKDGAAAKVLSKIAEKEEWASALSLTPAKAAGWNALFTADQKVIPASVVMGVKGETLFVGLADPEKLDEKPKLSAEMAALLKENAFGAMFFDTAAFWKTLRNEAENPTPLVASAFAARPETAAPIKDVLGADLAVTFVKLWVPTVETARLEFSLADINPDKALLPRLARAVNAFKTFAEAKSETTETGAVPAAVTKPARAAAK